MFQGRFKEAIELAQSQHQPYVLRLEDDEPLTMKTLCNMWHMRMDELPPFAHSEVHPDIEGKQLFRLAVLTNKYDCNGSTRCGTQNWLKSILDGWHSNKDAVQVYLRLLPVAYQIEDRAAFGKITSRLLKDWVPMNEASDSLEAVRYLLHDIRYPELYREY